MTAAELPPFIFSSLLLHKIQTICQGHHEPDSKATQAVKRFVLFIFCSFQRPLSLLLYIVIKCAKDDTVWAPLKGRKWNLLRSTSQVLRAKRVESTRKSVSHQIQTGGSHKLWRVQDRLTKNTHEAKQQTTYTDKRWRKLNTHLRHEGWGR